MKNFSRLAVLGALAACAVGAQAAGYDFNNYPAPEAVGHSAVSRAQVLTDLQVARTQGKLNVADAVYEMPKAQASAVMLTREQVREQTAAAERAGQLNYGG